MFRFASPLFLLLILVPILFVYFRGRKKEHHGIRMSSLEGLEEMTSISVSVSKLLFIVKIAAVLLLVLALARPQSGEKKINVSTEGINIILALDLSESMRALDFKRKEKIVTRLEAVKSVVMDFIVQRKGDRIGMVVFGTSAFTQIPLTRDYNTISFILEKLSIGSAGPNTAIGDAIGISLKRLEDIKSKSNIVILLTDGKSNSGELSWQDATRIAALRGVKIYTIGVGTKGKAPFLVDDMFGKRYVYRQVDVDLEALKTIAGETGGEFFQAKDLSSLEMVYKMINQLEKTKVDVQKWVEYRELYHWCLMPGLALLALYIFLINTRFLRVP